MEENEVLQAQYSNIHWEIVKSSKALKKAADPQRNRRLIGKTVMATSLYLISAYSGLNFKGQKGPPGGSVGGGGGRHRTAAQILAALSCLAEVRQPRGGTGRFSITEMVSFFNGKSGQKATARR